MSPRRGSRTLGSVFSRRTLVWVAAVVAALVIIDVTLVALALARTAPASHGTVGPVPTFSSASLPSVSPTPLGTATAGPAAMVTPGRHLLSAVDAKEAWRASSGTCGGAAGVLEHSVDGGVTWTRTGLGAATGAVLGLRADATGVAVVLGSGSACAPTVRTSADDGRTWRTGSAGTAGAGIGPDGLILSTGTIASPCSDPTDAYEGEFTTAVVCADEVQWRSGNGAWVRVPLNGVGSIADDGDAYLVARTGVPGCAGAEIRSMPAVAVTSATKTTLVGCAAAADPNGALALARTSSTVWLWSGDGVLVSADGGVTW